MTGELNQLKEENKDLKGRLEKAIEFLELMETHLPDALTFAWREMVKPGE